MRALCAITEDLHNVDFEDDERKAVAQITILLDELARAIFFDGRKPSVAELTTIHAFVRELRELIPLQWSAVEKTVGRFLDFWHDTSPIEWPAEEVVAIRAQITEAALLRELALVRVLLPSI